MNYGGDIHINSNFDLPQPRDSIKCNRNLNFDSEGNTVELELPLEGQLMYDFNVSCYPLLLWSNGDLAGFDLSCHYINSVTVKIDDRIIEWASYPRNNSNITYNLANHNGELKYHMNLEILNEPLISDFLTGHRLTLLFEFNGVPPSQIFLNYRVGLIPNLKAPEGKLYQKCQSGYVRVYGRNYFNTING